MRRTRFEPLEVPNYGFQEAVRYLHVPNSTLQYWTRPSISLLTPVDRQKYLFSFKNLVECYVLNGLREIHGVKVSRIRHALSYLRRNFPSRHPLADYEMDFRMVRGKLPQRIARRAARYCAGSRYVFATN